MMLFVNDDLHDDSDEELDDLILEISDDLVDSEIEKALISISEICSVEYSEEDFDDERECVNERI